MDYPLVSIVIPVYNVELYIEQCAKSLFEQTYQNLEFLFIDDASKDNSIQIVQNLIKDYSNRQSQLKIITHSINQGVGTTKKDGILSANGEFILEIDSDDYIETNTVELLIEKAIIEQADIVVYGLDEFCDNKVLRSFTPPSTIDKNEFINKIIRATVGYGYITNKLIRKSLFNDKIVGIIDGVNMAEDILMTYKLIYFSNKVTSIPDILYHYRRFRPGSLTKDWKIDDNTANGYCRILSDMDSFLKTYNVDNPIIHQALLFRKKRDMLDIIKSKHYHYLYDYRDVFKAINLDIIQNEQNLNKKQKYLLRLGNKYVTSKSPLRFLYSFALYLFTHFHKPKDIN